MKSLSFLCSDVCELFGELFLTHRTVSVGFEETFDTETVAETEKCFKQYPRKISCLNH